MQIKQIMAALPTSQAPGIVIHIVVPFQRMNHDRMCKELGGLVATGRLSFFDSISEQRLDRARIARFGDKSQTIEFVTGKNYDSEKIAAILSEFNLKFEVVDYGTMFVEPLTEKSSAIAS